MRFPEYKYLYADTNVVSDICKSKDLMKRFMKRYSIAEYLFCFSTYTLYEISKNDLLMKEFQKFYSIFPCVVIMSYFPLANEELKLTLNDIDYVDPVLISPQGVKIDGKSLNKNSLEVLISQSEVQDSFKTIEIYTNKYFEEMKNLFDSEEFNGVSKETCNRDQFIARFKKYELRHRFFGGKKRLNYLEKNIVIQMKSLEVLAQGIYYKFYSDSTRKISKSDIIDVLIMTSAPYVDTFISEGNCIDIFRKIVKRNKCGIKGNGLTLSELRRYG